MKRDPLKQFVSLRESLLKKKAALETELSLINKALAIEPGAPSAPIKAIGKSAATAVKRKRAKNEMSLKEAVLAVTKAKPLAKAEILAAVSKSGYTFTAKSPMNSLNTLLYGDKSFKNHDGKFGPA
jgi:hypothetical protein